jgi:mono/diheme cytochrome c family protein
VGAGTPVVPCSEPAAVSAGQPPKDAGVKATSQEPVAKVSTADAPTWTQVYSEYLALGTTGNCAGCHGGYGSAKAGYAKGGGAAWAKLGSSRLTWYGGDMPPGGPGPNDPQGAKARADMDAWLAAGAQVN